MAFEPVDPFDFGEVLSSSDMNIIRTNLNELDGRVRVCTSITRPAIPTDGMIIYETDTNKLLAYDLHATAWHELIGPTGPQGVQGIQGVTGPIGWTGPQGEIGPTGPTGPTGPQGETGPVGKFVASDTAPASPAIGDGWYKSSTGQLFVYYDNYWVETGTGAIGPTGPTGAAGVAGVVGPTGPTGPQNAVATSATAPGSASVGDLWLDTDDGSLYIYYDSFWVQITTAQTYT